MADHTSISQNIFRHAFTCINAKINIEHLIFNIISCKLLFILAKISQRSSNSTWYIEVTIHATQNVVRNPSKEINVCVVFDIN